MSLIVEYNPVADLFDRYANNRFTGNEYEHCYLEAVVAVQTELLRTLAIDDLRVKWFLKALNEKHLKANLEINFCKQLGERNKCH